VAIGTSHGFYSETPFIDHGRLKAIHELVKVPLVLHGGSCTPDEDIRKSIVYGIRKINIATEFHQAFIDGVISQSEIHRTKFSPIDVFMIPVYDRMKELVRQKITFFAGLE
jgi:fructose/tagatose bisphosphate aldolase